MVPLAQDDRENEVDGSLDDDGAAHPALRRLADARGQRLVRIAVEQRVAGLVEADEHVPEPARQPRSAMNSASTCASVNPSAGAS